MARALRIQYPGAFYHITSRGNERQEVFKSERDREKFLSYLQSAVARYSARIHVYCLMGNHYHLLLETVKGNLSQIMQHINGAYTSYFNTKRKRSGHLFQGRYKAILVDADEYATTLSRYIHLNPVRAGIVDAPEKFPWSSYQFYIGPQEAPEWLTTDFILLYFGRKPSRARSKYREFVVAAIGEKHENPLKEVVASTLLGGLDFIREIQEKYLDKNRKDRELPALVELTPRKTIEEIKEAADGMFGDDKNLARKAALFICHRYSGRKLSEIGVGFNIGDSAVSQASRRFTSMLDKDTRLKTKVEKLNRKLGLSNV